MFNKMFVSRTLGRWCFCSAKQPIPLLQQALTHQKLRDYQYSTIIDSLLKQNQPQTAFRVLLNSHLNNVILDAHSYYNIFLGLKQNKSNISYTEVLYKLYRQHFAPTPIMIAVMKTLIKTPGSEEVVREDLGYYEANKKAKVGREDGEKERREEEDGRRVKTEKIQEEEEEDEEEAESRQAETKQSKSKQKKRSGKSRRQDEAQKPRIYSQKQKVAPDSIPLKQLKVEFQSGKPFTMSEQLTDQLSKLINPFSQYSFNIHDVNIEFESFKDLEESENEEEEDVEYESEGEQEYTLMDVLAGVKNIRVGKIEIIKNKNDQ